MAKHKPKKATQIRGMMLTWDDYWRKNKKNYFRQFDFVLGEQWDQKESSVLIGYKKNPMVFNKVRPMANNVLGEQRANTTNIRVEPADDVPQETASVRGALVKDISFNSDSPVAYQTGAECSLIGGFGAWWVGTRYKNNKSFEQEIEINEIKDPTKCYWDTGAKSPCKTDGMYCGFRTPLTRRKFRAVWGADIEKKIGYVDYDTSFKKEKEPSQNKNRSQADKIKQDEGTTDSLADDSFIMQIDHFEVETSPDYLCELSNGDTVNYSEIEQFKIEKDIDPDLDDEAKKAKEKEEPLYMIDGEETMIIRQRPIQDKFKIWHYIYAGDYELEKTEVVANQLTLIFLDQHSRWNEQGEQITSGFFEGAQDPQRFLNYLKTQQAYVLKITRYDQFMGTKENAMSPKTQAMWADPLNTQGMLFYDKAKDGSKPERIDPPIFPDALIKLSEYAVMDIQTSTGIYDTAMGNQGDVVSGQAGRQQTRQGNKNTYLWRDNVNRAVRVTADIINSMIPSIYDTARSLKLTLPDTGNTTVNINQASDEYGNMQNDMTEGDYNIRLVPGPSYEGQQEDNIESFNSIIQADPTAAPLIMDLVVKSLPLSDAIEVANRLKTRIPPQVLEAGKSGKPVQQDNTPSPEAQAAQAQMEIAMQTLQLQKQKQDQDFAYKMQTIELNKTKLQLEAVKTNQDLHLEFERLDQEQRDAEAKAAEVNQRYDAEMKRIQADLHKTTQGHVKDILLHGTKLHHEMNKPDKETKQEGTAYAND